MSSRGQGSSPYRGRGRGRGRQGNILAQHGSRQLIAANLSEDKEYKEFLLYKKQNQGQIQTSKEGEVQNSPPSFAKVIATEVNDDALYNKNTRQEIILLLEERDLKWKNEPWLILTRYMDNAALMARTYKNRAIYEEMLIASGSCEVTHYSNSNSTVYNFSKLLIKKILTAEEWGISPQKEKEVFYKNTSFKYNYWDYIDAFSAILLYENDKRKHSWFVKIYENIFQDEIPNWFLRWWQYYGTESQILPEELLDQYHIWLTISPKIRDLEEKNNNIAKIATLLFFAEFSIPWIWKWSPIFGYTEEYLPCLKRNYFTKFWDKMVKLDPDTKKPYGYETISLIKTRLENYQKINDLQESNSPSPFEYIQRKLQMRTGNATKEEIVNLYIEEMKKDLMTKIERGGSKSPKTDVSMKDTKSVMSDSSMADSHKDYQDAQDPNDGYDIEDIFDSLKDTLQDYIKPREASSSGTKQEQIK